MLPAKRLPGERVPDRRGDCREVSPPHRLRRHRTKRARRRFAAHAFVGAHEERLVAPVIESRDDHRAIHLRAELVAFARILGQQRVLVVSARVERRVLVELEDRAMGGVGAALGHDVDVNAEVGAVLGGRAAGLHLDLRHGVRDRPHAGRGEEIRGGIDAVERQAVLNLTLAGAAEAQADIAVEAAEDTWRRARQAPDVAAAQRQLHDGAFADRF